MTPIPPLLYATAASLVTLTVPRGLGWTLAPDLFALGAAVACLPQPSRRDHGTPRDAWRAPMWALTTGLARDLTLGLPLGCSALAFVSVAWVLNWLWHELATSAALAAVGSALVLDMAGRVAELACGSSAPGWALVTRALWLAAATTATAAAGSLVMVSLGGGRRLARTPAAGRRP